MLFYRCLLTLLAPVIAIAMLMRVLRGKESFTNFAERMGFWGSLPKNPTIWLHGASNGELTAAKTLVEYLMQANRHDQILITCNSVSAKNMVLNWGLERVFVHLAPVDLRWIYRRLMTRMQVTSFILLEGDFWPNRILAAQQLGVPLALVGGRVSVKSTKIWSSFARLSQSMFAAFDLIYPQDDASDTRLKTLGAPPEIFGPTLSLKSLYQGKHEHNSKQERAKFWLAASTHEDEDEVLLRAHLEILKHAPEMQMILAPRHPNRGDAVAKLAGSLGLKVTQRSMGSDLAAALEVYIADTLGEMHMWYDASNTCFVAGSLVQKGGHTPYEPFSHDCAILHGPHVENFNEPYSALQSQAGSILCQTEAHIADAVLTLRDPGIAGKQRNNAQVALGATNDLTPVLAALSKMSQKR